MDERPDQIVEHIERERHTLGRNLDELHNRIKSTTDWRAQFDRHPMTMLGVAMGGGLLIGAMVTGKRRSSSQYWRNTSGLSSRSYAGRSYATSSYSSPSAGNSYSSPSRETSSHESSTGVSGAMQSLLDTSTPAMRYQKSKAVEVFDTMKGALLAYGISQARDWLNQMLPGFAQHYDETAKRNQSRSEASSSSSQQPGSGAGPYGGAPGHTGGSQMPSGSMPGSGTTQSGSQRPGSGMPQSGSQTQGGGTHTTTQTPNPSSTRQEPTPAL